MRRQVGGEIEKGKSRSGRGNMDSIEDGSLASNPDKLNHGTFVKETPLNKEKYLGKSLIDSNKIKSERASASHTQTKSGTCNFVSNEDAV